MIQGMSQLGKDQQADGTLSLVLCFFSMSSTRPKKDDFPHLYIKACFRSDTETAWKLINFKFGGTIGPVKNDWPRVWWVLSSGFDLGWARGH